MASKKSKDITRTELKYNSKTLKEILCKRPDLNEFVELINELLKNEGCKNKTAFTTEKCLNLDKIEKSKSSKGKTSDISPSMDFTIGMDNNKFMLVEAKLRVKDDINFCSELKKKITASKSFINNDLHCCVHKDTVILLSICSKIEQMKNKVRRQMNNAIDIKPMNVIDFHKSYFE